MKVISSNDFKELVLESKKIVIVDFFATWCPPCRMLGPVLEQLSVEMTDVDFYKIDADENTDLAIELHATALPTLIIFADGEEKERIVGFKPKQIIQETLNKYL